MEHSGYESHTISYACLSFTSYDFRSRRDRLRYINALSRPREHLGLWPAKCLCNRCSLKHKGFRERSIMLYQNLKKHIVSFGLTLTFLMTLILGGSATAMAQHRDRDRDDHRRWEQRDRNRDHWDRDRRERTERQWRYRNSSPMRTSGYYDRFGRFHSTGYYDIFGRFHRY